MVNADRLMCLLLPPSLFLCANPGYRYLIEAVLKHK